VIPKEIITESVDVTAAFVVFGDQDLYRVLLETHIAQNCSHLLIRLGDKMIFWFLMLKAEPLDLRL
jgi:hypothetical protein